MKWPLPNFLLNSASEMSYELSALHQNLINQMVVSTQVIKDDGLSYINSAVKIDHHHFLTAAHCLEGASTVVINIEDHKIPVQDWVIHPEYNQKKSNYLFDIAIMRTPFLTKLERARMGDRDIKADGYFRLGRGREEKVLSPSTLILTQTEQQKYFHTFYDETSVVGDSGGGIFQVSSGRLQLIGIHSTKEFSSHRNRDFIYAVDISCFFDWINQYISGFSSIHQ